MVARSRFYTHEDGHFSYNTLIFFHHRHGYGWDTFIKGRWDIICWFASPSISRHNEHLMTCVDLL
jgi:hypothetical protein